MFSNLLLQLGAWAMGFTPKQLAFIEARFPALRKLIATITKAQPLIERLVPLINEAEPIVNETLPLIKEAAAELQVVAPAIEMVLGVIEKHTAQGKPQSQVLETIQKALASAESTLSRL